LQKWLSVVGIGEDGLEGLSPIAQTLVAQAKLIVGGDRHLAMLPPISSGENQTRAHWTSPIEASVAGILRHRGQNVCVLASGDPLCYGIGNTLLRQIPIAEMTIVPAPSAFSLACSRLGWSLTEVESLSLCGRDPALLHAVLYPGARLLVLSESGKTPAIVAKLLTEKGFGKSQMTVLERMGGTQERKVEGIASAWASSTGIAGEETELAALNTIAISCIADFGAPSLSRLAGLPDAVYHHDGQLTKQEVRAITLAALAPLPGQLLWDVGAGCGSIGIEWMRTHARCHAIAIEQHPDRLSMIAHNAIGLGTPTLKLIAGSAPAVLHTLPAPDAIPDAIFIGGGLTSADLLETCWQALRSGGRLVANAVTVESEQQVLHWQSQLGGTLTRIAIQRAEPIGKFLGWKAMAPVTQWKVSKGKGAN
jgi:precorrin-6B C5,15-methyltransferase / cobalt-precorrin-6B C5,C15-methyltransferase